MLKLYAVISPEFETYGATEYEPPEWGADYAEVEAENPQDAKVFAVRYWRSKEYQRDGRSWPEWADHPFQGLRVEEINVAERDKMIREYDEAGEV